MQAEGKYNQIASWFNTPEPLTTETPEPPTPTPPKTVGVGKSIVDFFFRIIGFFLWVVIFYTILWIIGWIILEIIIRIPWFMDMVSKDVYDMESSLVVGLTLIILAIILTIIFVAIPKAREKAKVKAEYDAAKVEAKAEYDAAKVKYDALPSVSQMEQWLEEDLENLKKGALQKTGLDEESEILAEQPIITRVPSSEWRPRSPKASEHKHYLFPIWYLTILYTSDRSIVVYNCEYDWGDNRLFSESTTEYFYKDIVAVERRSMGFDEIINISMSNGSSVGIALNGQGSTELSSRVDKAAQGIRRLLKDRKEDSEDSK